MRHRLVLGSVLVLLVLAAAPPASAQAFRTQDPVVERIWRLGMDSSQTERLAQVLMDSIGPRLSGTAGYRAAGEWLERTYQGWGVPVRREPYGTWRGWRHGLVHMELVAPRFRNLEVQLLAWSAGTGGRPVEGEVVALPLVSDTAGANAWLRTIKGKFVLFSYAEPMCRAEQELERWARPATVTRLKAEREEGRRAWFQNLRHFNTPQGGVFRRLEDAGAAGVLNLFWSGGWGVNKVMSAGSDRIPQVDLSCEDFGLLHRLATNRQGPRVRLTADAQALPDQPMFNVIAELKGSERPDEYVVLSAHLDSWHSASGATDNGTGTITMLEAMRILREAYPRPRRTILVGHWGGEEQGLNGSGAFAEDHPEVIRGLQAAFNQDNGTWRADTLEAQGFAGAGASLARWLSIVPGDISDHLRLVVPGPQNNSGSDHTSFVCRQAPGFRLQSAYPEYRQYTWHTNRDTYDKVVFDDLKNNATLAALLAYAASEDPERTPREVTVLPPDQSGRARAWPRCFPSSRSYAPRTR